MKISASHSFLISMLMIIGLSGCDFLRGYAEGRSDIMLEMEQNPPDATIVEIAQFLYGDFGSLNTDTLNTNAIPWKVAVASVLLEKHGNEPDISLTHYYAILKQFGFIIPDNIATHHGQLTISIPASPIGIIRGTIERSIPTVKLEVANIGCASCHAGKLYDKEGMPLNTLYPGLPNTSIDLDSYVRTIYSSMKNVIRRPDDVIMMMTKLFPDMSDDELDTVRKYVLPEVKIRYQGLEAGIDAPLPFNNGGPGITNGVAALKLRLGILSGDKIAEEYGYTSIPDLGGTLLRSSLLYDGVYATPGVSAFQPVNINNVSTLHRDNLATITAFFTVPTMGISPGKAREGIPKVKQVFRFLEAYQPPVFPGDIEQSLARQGAVIYRQHCAQCHGSYTELSGDAKLKPPLTLVQLPNRLSEFAEIGTDQHRAATIDATLSAAIRDSDYGKYVFAAPTKGYAAKPLSAVWATAPYLHNGSVPSLWALMNPELRPQKFYVGGHKLDYKQMGIAHVEGENGVMVYPSDYTPWSTPKLYDTDLPGRSNQGHENEFADLSIDSKKQLMEFLKLL